MYKYYIAQTWIYIKNKVCETRAWSEHKNNWECQKWGKKKDSTSAIESVLLTMAEADTEFCNFNPLCWVGLGNE